MGLFPDVRFYGEEYDQSYNTKYFRAIDLGPEGDYLVTLDPIDGTRFYLDGHANYQIILTVLNHDEFEAVIALSPGQGTYTYALRNQGTFAGTFADHLDDCQPLHIKPSKAPIHLGWGLSSIAEKLKPHYAVNNIETDYSVERTIPNLSGILSGDLSGAIIRAGKFIDGGALAFLAQEAGCIVTTFDGSSPPPLYACENYGRPGLILATSPEIHQHLLEAVNES